MRVISGSARGRRLISPEGFDVRPTTDKVKESVFNIIQFELENACVLDLFAGSGQLGIEALSRGAACAVFVDASKKSLDTVKKNIETTGFQSRSKIVCSDAFAFLSSCSGKFDIVFLDPPYEKGLCERAFGYLPPRLSSGAVVICETRADEVLPDNVGELALSREYVYSAVKLSVYRANTVKE